MVESKRLLTGKSTCLLEMWQADKVFARVKQVLSRRIDHEAEIGGVGLLCW